MSARIIDGKAISAKVRSEVKSAVDDRTRQGHRAPGLATVLVGDDPASHTYVKNKRKAAEETGIKSFHHELPSSTTQEELLALIRRLNADPAVDGILVQLPLPKHISERAVIRTIDPDKDVDGFHPATDYAPCTPLGCIRLLDEYGVAISGANAVVLGRSNIVGRPVAKLLLDRDATVTIAHSKTRDLAAVTRGADILVVAIGRTKMIRAEHVKPGATVIDVGINRDENNKLCGDVDFDAVKEIAGAITPVPGGVGPMTIAMLMQNTLTSHAKRLGL